MLSKENAINIITSLAKVSSLTQTDILKILKGNKKSEILKWYHALVSKKELHLDKSSEHIFFNNIRMKQVRTLSGVTPVTVLTKPFPCPGKCIFCPNDIRMPKSYLSDEPGAQRALQNRFDPYYQTYNRLVALSNIGHPTDKVELIVLGGTWTAYPQEYRIWFIQRCFEAMNAFDLSRSIDYIDPTKLELPFDESKLQTASEENKDVKEFTYNQRISSALTTKESSSWEELFKVHAINETAKSRCVGLVIETRPDEITPDEVTNIRKLGATKVQLGVQSLDDSVLLKNKRGHTVAQTAAAFTLLRQAGFKIHVHWMPNLYGSSPSQDIEDYKKLVTDARFCPDEIKIYPCSLIAGTELMQIYESGLWKPYTTDELLHILTECYAVTPRYCRITRMIRDIPGNNIVLGNKITNFRQLVETELKKRHRIPVEIRAREIGNNIISEDTLVYNSVEYFPSAFHEYFLEFITESANSISSKIAGFLRLSLHKDHAIIREIHVYGQSIEVGHKSTSSPQHLGLGKKLIAEAKTIAREKGYTKLYVISSVGTREYYRSQGFSDAELYQVCEL